MSDEENDLKVTYTKHPSTGWCVMELYIIRENEQVQVTINHRTVEKTNPVHEQSSNNYGNRKHHQSRKKVVVHH